MIPPYLFRVEGLAQSSTELLTGKLYGTYLNDDNYAPCLIGTALLNKVVQGGQGYLVSSTSNCDQITNSKDLSVQIKQAIDEGSVRVFVRDSGSSLSAIDYALRLVEEIRFYRLPKNAFLVIDDVGKFLDPLKKQDLKLVLRALRNFAEEFQLSILLLFRQTDNFRVEKVFSIAPDLAGLGRLRFEGGIYWWDILHWFGGSSFFATQTLHLKIDTHGKLLGHEQSGSEIQAGPSMDDALVYAQKGALENGIKPEKEWILFESDQEMLKHCLVCVSASIIFVMSRQTLFGQMARAIFDLRNQCGKRIKIIVRETDTRLRYSQESLVLRLGANLVVAPEITHARLLSLLSMLQGQVYNHVLPESYDDAAAMVTPSSEQGYLAPKRFVEATTEALVVGRNLGVQSVLVRLNLAYGLEPKDALRYCIIKRLGDLCTADLDHVYLFLFACRDNDVALAISHLFTLPVSDLFCGEDDYWSEQAIQMVLLDFSQRIENNLLPDLGRFLYGNKSATPIQHSAKSTNQIIDQVMLNKEAPIPAIPFPLTLRQDFH